MGLNAQKCLWVFPCVLDQTTGKFFVWMGDVTLDKFTKSTFMNLAGFADKSSATKLVLVQTRNHPQKGTIQQFILIAEFKRLFTVLDAIRVSKRQAGEFLGQERMAESLEKYALYCIDLD